LRSSPATAATREVIAATDPRLPRRPATAAATAGPVVPRALGHHFQGADTEVTGAKGLGGQESKVSMGAGIRRFLEATGSV